jgi:hypothetical protein
VHPLLPASPPRRGYWQRYGRRWARTVAVVATIAVTVDVLRALSRYGPQLFAQPPTWLGYAVLAAALIGVVVGSVVNLVVAVVSDRTLAPAPASNYRPDPRFIPYGNGQPPQDM